MAFAILQSERDNKPLLYAEVIQNWSSFSYKDFWQEMISENYIWMFDENGQEFYDPSKLPSSLSDMRDDPYRSLAWVVRERGGFDNSNVPYAELMWANFFRSLVRVGIDSSDEEFEEAADIGVKLARSESASHLPGFKPKFRYINPL